MNPGSRTPHSENGPWQIWAILLGSLGLAAWILLGWSDHWTVFIPVLIFAAGFLSLLG